MIDSSQPPYGAAFRKCGTVIYRWGDQIKTLHDDKIFPCVVFARRVISTRKRYEVMAEST